MERTIDAMKNDKEKYREQLMALAREGKLSIMQGWDLDYQYLPTNDGKGLIFALGVGCSACFTPEEWHSLLDEVYASNPVYSARLEDIVAIPYKDEDGWPCVRFELRENLQQISREEVMDKYIVQGTTSVHRPQTHELSEEKMKEIEEKYLKNSKEQ